jgi:hypothetical protein
MSDQSEVKLTLKETIVGRLSPHDSSIEGMLAKTFAAWLGFFGGVTLSDVFTFASIVYVCLNIFVLVRDKLLRNKGEKVTGESNGKDSSGE